VRVLVVLPTYNEAENIDRVLRRIRTALPDGSVLVVDDGSPDGTATLAEKLGAELGNIEVLRRSAKSGLGSAYRAGFAWGLQRGWEAFVEMDADLSHEPEALPSLIAPLAQGVDLVVGSRYVPGGSIPNWRWHRRLLSQGSTSPTRPPVSGPTGPTPCAGSTSTPSKPRVTGSRSRWCTKSSSTGGM
jgi:dolichol-phosphate mannosyltransferase